MSWSPEHFWGSQFLFYQFYLLRVKILMYHKATKPKLLLVALLSFQISSILLSSPSRILMQLVANSCDMSFEQKNFNVSPSFYVNEIVSNAENKSKFRPKLFKRVILDLVISSTIRRVLIFSIVFDSLKWRPWCILRLSSLKFNSLLLLAFKII